MTALEITPRSLREDILNPAGGIHQLCNMVKDLLMQSRERQHVFLLEPGGDVVMTIILVMHMKPSKL